MNQATTERSLPETRSPSLRRRSLKIIGRYGTIFGLIGMIVGFSIASDSFLTVSNLVDIVDQGSLVAIIAGGVTIALVVGDFDLSIGFMASLAGVLVAGLIAKQELPVPVAILIVLLIGVGVGLANGLIVTKTGVNALIATLGTGTILVGLDFGYNQGGVIAFGLPQSFLDISEGGLFAIPNDIVIMAIALAVLWVLLNLTELGLQMQAVGGNAEAARLSGVRVDRVKISAFIICAVSAALTGILLASRIGSGQPTAGDGYLLDAYAAAYLGSAVLKDGEFHLLGTLIGVLTVSVGFNGMAIIGVPTFYQYLFKGGLLLVAMALGTVARKYAKG